MPMTFMFTDDVRLGCVVIASDNVNVFILGVLWVLLDDTRCLLIG